MSAIAVPSPIGLLHLVANAEAITGLRFAGEPAPAVTEPTPLLTEAAAQLRAWLEGRLRDFDLPLMPAGTAFQQEVWAALRQIPYGATRTYREQALAIGRPAAVRAVGAANGRNPIPILIPCHRVIGADGSLTGFGGGLPAKRWLLGHEAAYAGLFTR